jgi:hypothetical protein
MTFRMPEIKSPAEYAKDSLVSGLRGFEATLRNDEEMVIDFDGLPAGHRVHHIGTAASYVVFHSVDSEGRRAKTYLPALGSRVTIMAQAKPDDQPEARRMGFEVPS